MSHQSVPSVEVKACPCVKPHRHRSGACAHSVANENIEHESGTVKNVEEQIFAALRLICTVASLQAAPTEAQGADCSLSNVKTARRDFNVRPCLKGYDRLNVARSESEPRGTNGTTDHARAVAQLSSNLNGERPTPDQSMTPIASVRRLEGVRGYKAMTCGVVPSRCRDILSTGRIEMS